MLRTLRVRCNTNKNLGHGAAQRKNGEFDQVETGGELSAAAKRYRVLPGECQTSASMPI